MRETVHVGTAVGLPVELLGPVVATAVWLLLLRAPPSRISDWRACWQDMVVTTGLLRMFCHHTDQVNMERFVACVKEEATHKEFALTR